MRSKESPSGNASAYHRSSGSSSAGLDHDTAAYELENLREDAPALGSAPARHARWWYKLPWRPGLRPPGTRSSFRDVCAPLRRRVSRGRLIRLITLSFYFILTALVAFALLLPSYTHPPQRYTDLRKRVSSDAGSANVNKEKVFIAASLYDHEGELLSGDWGRAVLSLIDILGNDNVYLSIYENDPDDKARAALDSYKSRVKCESTIVAEQLDLHQFPRVTTADGRQLLKRVAFLADVRNRALRPLEDPASGAFGIRFDKLLYINDVIFDPVDAANLMFSTNADESTGKTDYRAACAVDFINPFKFYDTFATRDLEGYDMGVPFYPWFTNAGRALSRRDVLEQKDAVRVKSCWGGMVAFDARWFQARISGSGGAESADNASSPLRFRAEEDTYWDASECCLIHADLTAMEPSLLASGETGIYMNPYIRVAYSGSVLSWLAFTRRFERLYAPVHRFVNWIASRPSFNPRQNRASSGEVLERVWVWDPESAAALSGGTVASPEQLHGQFEEVRRTALPGGFCGTRRLLYINEHPEPGESKWGSDKVPPGFT